MSPESQNARILAALKKGEPLTQLDALKRFSCLRLSGRVYDLRRKGHKIFSTPHVLENGKRVALYWMAAATARGKKP